MRNFIVFVSLALTWNSIRAANLTANASLNKTKRGLVDQTNYYGDPGALKYLHAPVYHDSVAAATNPGTVPTYYPNNQRTVLYHNPAIKTAEGESPKQVAVQQVLYEYQQTPHNAVSNVHVNQQFQTAPLAVPDTIHAQTSFPSAPINPHFVNQHHVLQVEPNQFAGVATPVQHGAVINHGQGFSKIFYGPFPVVQTTSGPIVQTNAQPKYIYANGKIVYHPSQANLQVNNPYSGVGVTPRPQTLLTNVGFQPRAPLVTQKPFKPSPLIPITYGTQIAYPKVPAKPTQAPVKEEVEEEEEEKSDVREESDEEGDSDDHSSYEEEEEDDYRPAYYSKYRYEDDDDDHESYREHEDEEEEDNTRSYTRYTRKKPKKYRSESKPKYEKNDNYKYREGYEASNRYSTKCKVPNECFKHESSGKKPKSQYKSYKFYKSSSDSKPKKEVIEGRQSQNVPVVHNKKLIRQEKWLVTKKNGSE